MDTQIQFNNQRNFVVKALLDLGCTGTTLLKEFVRKNNIGTKKIIRPVFIQNANGSVNQKGPIIDYIKIKLTMNDHKKQVIVAIAKLSKTDLFIRYEWLKYYSSNIDQQEDYIKFAHCSPSCGYYYSNRPVSVKELVDGPQKDPLFNIQMININEDKEKVKTLKNQILGCIADYINVFNKKSFETLLKHQLYDYVIELTPNFKLSHRKVFYLSPHKY